jgi:hypothetical protein
MPRFSLVTVMSATSLLAACASTGPMGDTVGSSLRQPLRDLNVMRDTPIEVLVQAKAAPYRAPSEPVCASITAELALLDAALGRDIDAVGVEEKDDLAGKLAGDAIGDLMGLPYRGVFRRLTGAERQEREARARKLAGSIRRAFLKGWAPGAGCSQPPPG